MKKLMNKKGFTLMEMLIVIAIIVILVAIAVPSFTASLEKANKATDAANFRAAESAAMIKAMETHSADTVYHYDLATGTLVTGAGATEDMGSCTNHSTKYIKVTIHPNGTADVVWSNGTTDDEATGCK